jgi:hypothetical protein
VQSGLTDPSYGTIYTSIALIYSDRVTEFAARVLSKLRDNQSTRFGDGVLFFEAGF